MLMLVIAAFGGACFTSFGAYPADFLRLFASEAHQLCSRITNRRAFHVEPDATRHHPDIIFLRTRSGAVVAECGAFQARFDTGFIGVVVFHDDNFKTFKLLIIPVARLYNYHYRLCVLAVGVAFGRAFRFIFFPFPITACGALDVGKKDATAPKAAGRTDRR